MDALTSGTEMTVNLLTRALKQGVTADYVLFDSWFSSSKMFVAIRELELHTIAIVKKTDKVHYTYQGKKVSVKTLYKNLPKRRGKAKYLLSLVATATSEGGINPCQVRFCAQSQQKE